MATISSFKEQVKNREADWKLGLRKRFRLRHLRFEWGRWCCVVHPVEGCSDYFWWEWENE